MDSSGLLCVPIACCPTAPPRAASNGGAVGQVGEDVGICGGKWLTVGGSGDYGDLRGTAGVSRSGEPQCLLECMSAN